jgi:hypothetical protein
MRRALAILATVAAVSAMTTTDPAQARNRHRTGLLAQAAGVVPAGVYGAYGPYYGSGPGYGYYYPPRYYGPAYAYYGSPYYRQHQSFYWGYW